MGTITKIAAFFRNSKNEKGDEQFRDAAEICRATFEKIQPLTTRSLELNEFSDIWLDAIELRKHQEAISELTASFKSLGNSFAAIDSTNNTYENKFNLYSAACDMQRKVLLAYAKAAVLTNLAAARQQFNLYQKKSNASRESPAAEAAVQVEIDALNQLSKAAESSQKEAESLELELNTSLAYARLVFESGH